MSIERVAEGRSPKHSCCRFEFLPFLQFLFCFWFMFHLPRQSSLALLYSPQVSIATRHAHKHTQLFSYCFHFFFFILVNGQMLSASSCVSRALAVIVSAILCALTGSCWPKPRQFAEISLVMWLRAPLTFRSLFLFLLSSFTPLPPPIFGGNSVN